MRIFLDMDDVMADFSKFAISQLGCNKARWSQEEWATLAKHPRMYRWLDPTPWARELYEACIELAPGQVHFLTAVPKGNDIHYAFQDKVLWAKNWFPCTPVFFGPFSKDKHTHCKGSHDILVDDRDSNIEEWIAAGGKGIKFVEVKQAINELRNLFTNV